MKASHPVVETLGYVKRFAGETVLVKLGGAALQDEALVRSLCDDFVLLQSVGVRLVLVHGGGPSINRELTIHGIQWEFVDGQRVTTPEVMEIVEQTLCGSVNRRIVRTLNDAGVKAVGLSGADAGTLYCKAQSTRLGQVGQVEEVDPALLRSLLALGAIPVMAPVGYGAGGRAFNVNADWAAIRVAQALGVSKVVYLTDQTGILDSDGKLLSELSSAQLEALVEKGAVTGGMLAKVQTILHGLRHGLKEIHVLNARHPHVLIEELFTSRGAGTLCRSRARNPSAET